jgi:hypothetical protein
VIHVEDLYPDQLAAINLQWVDLHDIYDDIAEGCGTVLCYDGRFGLDPTQIFDLERLISSGGSRDEILLFLHEIGDCLEDEGWLLAEDEGDDADLHTWRELRTGVEDRGGY